MIFLDSNIPMYLIGASHPLKDRTKMILEELIKSRSRLVTSSEVLQEICHRYCAINRREFIQPAFDAVYGIIDQIFPITVKDVEESKSLLLGYTDVSARDALHAAFCKNLGIKEIFSFDKVFERFNWLRRIY